MMIDYTVHGGGMIRPEECLAIKRATNVGKPGRI